MRQGGWDFSLNNSDFEQPSIFESIVGEQCLELLARVLKDKIQKEVGESLLKGFWY